MRVDAAVIVYKPFGRIHKYTKGIYRRNTVYIMRDRISLGDGIMGYEYDSYECGLDYYVYECPECGRRYRIVDGADIAYCACEYERSVFKTRIVEE